jgi:hypothetical protein
MSSFESSLRALDISALLQSGAREIPDSFGCGGMTSLVTLDLSTLPIEKIGSGCFNGASLLQELKLSETTKTIGPGSFCNLQSLEFVTFPNSVEFVSAKCFTNCPKLKRLVFEGPTKVHRDAFRMCHHPDLVFDRQWDKARLYPDSPFPFPILTGRFDDMVIYFSNKERFDKEVKCQITGEKFVYGMMIIILPCGHMGCVAEMIDWFEEHNCCPTCKVALK